MWPALLLIQQPKVRVCVRTFVRYVPVRVFVRA